MENITQSKIPTTIQNVSSVEEILESLDQYIIRQVADAIGKRPSLVHPDVLDLEIDEIAQEIRVKFWHMLQKQSIASPKSYIRRMARNAVCDVFRHREPILPLPLDEHGELYQGRMLLIPSESMRNPSILVEQERLEEEHIRMIVDVIRRLPDRQQQATLWVLKDVACDIYLLEVVCKSLGVDLATVSEPRTREELRRFRASYFIALQRLEYALPADIMRSIRVHTRSSNKHQRLSRHAKKQFAVIAAQKSGGGVDPLEDITLMMRHVDKISQSYGKAIRLHYENHLPYEDIANELNVPVATAKSYIRWGRSQLLRYVEKEEDDKMLTSILTDIDRLKEPYRTALRLRRGDRLSYEEIAQQLHIAEGTAKSYVSRGLTLLYRLTSEGEHNNNQNERDKRLLEIQIHIHKLREPYQTAIRLRYIERQSYAQIASQLDVPIGTVKARVSRGYRELSISTQEER